MCRIHRTAWFSFKEFRDDGMRIARYLATIEAALASQSGSPELGAAGFPETRPVKGALHGFKRLLHDPPADCGW